MGKMYFILLFFFSIDLEAQLNYVEITGKIKLLNAIGDSSMYIGLNAGMSDDQTDNENLFIGLNCGKSNISGNDNLFIGHETGYSNTLGNDNVFVGRFTGNKNTIGSSNTFVGRSAGRDNMEGLDNTFLGRSAGLLNFNGSNNTFIGRSAGGSNTNGRDNTFVGRFAGANNTSADDNTFMGRFAGQRHRLGNNNTFIGESCGVTDSLGTQNTIVGANADILNYDQFNSGAFGYLAKSVASNEIVIGNTAVTVIGGYTSWSNLSDGRFKKDVNQNVKGLDFIMKLRPVTYHLDNTALNQYLYLKDELKNLPVNNQLMTGFIAQEVETASMESGFEFSGVVKPGNESDYYKLRYGEFVVPLTKAIQEQQGMIQQLQEEIKLLKLMLNAK